MAKENTLNEEKEVFENQAAESTEAENIDTTAETTECEETVVEELSEVDQLSAELAAIKDKHIRLQAEFDNYRKRTLKERMELTKTAGASILVSLLPIMDDFERAIQHIGDADNGAAVKEGIDLIYGKFGEFLKQNGVVAIDAVEKDFDTDLHEAITKIPAPTKKLKGKVVDCVEKGYTLNEKVIRFAKVVIGE